MKHFSSGLFAGLLIGLLLATATFALADQPIKLIINGNEIVCDVAPQMINNRTMVPARFVAEALGATVEWDENQNAVVITSAAQTEINNSDVPAGFYTGRDIFNALVKKYPNMKITSGNPITGPVEGEISFDGQKLWFGKQEFILPIIVIQNQQYSSIAPLLKAGILTLGDI